MIKRQIDKGPVHFIGFSVPKFITNKTSDNVILEFNKDGKIIRKWVKKEDIILLTEDKDFFLKTMKRFELVEKAQKALVEDAQKELEKSVENFSETIGAEIEAFEELRDNTDIPCVIKGL